MNFDLAETGDGAPGGGQDSADPLAEAQRLIAAARLRLGALVGRLTDLRSGLLASEGAADEAARARTGAGEGAGARGSKSS